MGLLDRWIAMRFLGNFALIFSVMFLFGVSIDTILQLDSYIDASRMAVDAGRFSSLWTAVPVAVVDFNAPRVFQFFAYLLGLCSVAAAGFTVTQMVRTRELVAMLSAGVSLWRVGLAMVAVAVGLNLLQLINGELILPRLAPMLVRETESILQAGVRGFPVRLVQDINGTLILAQSFEPATETAQHFLVIERDERGGATRRIEARSATWNQERGGWTLVEGLASGRAAPTNSGDASRANPNAARIDRSEAIDFVATDISPKSILARRFRGFAQLLSAPQIAELARDGGLDQGVATRIVGQRFAGACVNLLMLVICLPFFLLREPQKMLRPSVVCAVVSVTGLLGSLFVMTVPLPFLPATVGVFLPVALLMPIAAGRVGSLRT